MYGELGRMPLQLYRYYRIVKFWIKILHCEEAKYIRIVYNTMYNDMTTKPNIVNWCSLLRDLFLIGLPGEGSFKMLVMIS